MKLLDLSITSLILRFYLLMAIVVGAGFSGYWAISLLALPVFFSALMGIKIRWPKAHVRSHKADSTGLQHAH
ncbi:MAG: hypothetical protein IPP15_07675 [Saprospiraceae bacterium]|uniref:Uncharacterized protein n=1 Tax=Candidatus Opimibacter skivensis TaxID=2982028 RepID=A0A9D7SUB7_9BACT|nr:hypothetical protein [Candidatus Opimibacter skivensis]